MLLRTDHPSSTDPNAQAEMGRIPARALSSGELPAADKKYAAQMVASRTGLNQADAEQRLTDVFEQAKTAAAQAAEKAKEAAEVACKTGIDIALWAFVSLLVGATIGGDARDNMPVVPGSVRKAIP